MLHVTLCYKVWLFPLPTYCVLYGNSILVEVRMSCAHFSLLKSTPIALQLKKVGIKTAQIAHTFSMTSNQSIIPIFGDKQNFIPFHEKVTILWCASHKSHDIKIVLVSFKLNSIFSSQVQLVCF